MSHCVANIPPLIDPNSISLALLSLTLSIVHTGRRPAPDIATSCLSWVWPICTNDTLLIFWQSVADLPPIPWKLMIYFWTTTYRLYPNFVATCKTCPIVNPTNLSPLPTTSSLLSDILSTSFWSCYNWFLMLPTSFQLLPARLLLHPSWLDIK